MKLEGILAIHDTSGLALVRPYYTAKRGESWIGDPTIHFTRDRKQYVEGVLLNPAKISPTAPGQHPAATAQYMELIDLSKNSHILV